VVHHLQLSDDGEIGPIGEWFDLSQPFFHRLSGDVVWPALRNEPIQSADYDHLLDLARTLITEGDRRPFTRRWEELPVEIRIGDFTERDPGWPDTLDYDRAVREAIGWWETATGMDLFVEVDASPERGIEVIYHDLEPPLLGQVTFDAWLASGAFARGRLELQTRFGSPSGYALTPQVAAHELGHVLGLFGHSTDAGHVMAQSGYSQADRVSEDEAKLVPLLYALPLGFDLTLYVAD
jgi:hypothetical protein